MRICLIRKTSQLLMCLNRSLRKGKRHSLSSKAHLNHCYKHSEKGVLQRELLLHQRKQPAPQKQSSDLASATTWCFKSRAINQSQNEFIIFTSLTIRSSLWAALNDNSGTLTSTSKDCHAIMSGARAGSWLWHAQRPAQGSQDQQRSHPSCTPHSSTCPHGLAGALPDTDWAPSSCSTPGTPAALVGLINRQIKPIWQQHWALMTQYFLWISHFTKVRRNFCKLIIDVRTDDTSSFIKGEMNNPEVVLLFTSTDR